MLELNRNYMLAINIAIKTNTPAFELGIESIAVRIFNARNLFTVVVSVLQRSEVWIRRFWEASTMYSVHI